MHTWDKLINIYEQREVVSFKYHKNIWNFKLDFHSFENEILIIFYLRHNRTFQIHTYKKFSFCHWKLDWKFDIFLYFVCVSTTIMNLKTNHIYKRWREQRKIEHFQLTKHFVTRTQKIKTFIPNSHDLFKLIKLIQSSFISSLFCQERGERLFKSTTSKPAKFVISFSLSRRNVNWMRNSFLFLFYWK